MVRPRVKHCGPVIPSGQASGYIARQNAVHRRVVQTLEIHKFSRVCRRRLTEPSQLLNHNMRMSKNVPIRVDLLGAGHVGLLRIREPTGFEMIDRNRDGERRILRKSLKVWREDELGGGHVIEARNDTYRGGVTRSTCIIETGEINRTSRGNE